MRVFQWIVLLAGLASSLACAAEANTFPSPPAVPAPEQDDASLNAVAFSNPQTAWAVGDRGVIWRSVDRGDTWQFRKIPSAHQSTALTRVRFLTDRVGWISGKAVSPAGNLPIGLLLCTTDGGETWSIRNRDPLPPLNDIQFFDLDEGIAVGEPTPRFPTGVLRTHDGGQSWQPLASAESNAWLAATFDSPEQGICVGPAGRIASIARETLLPGSEALKGLRSLTALASDPQGGTWLAGDGGLLLKSQNRGLSWQPAEGSIPASISEATDFHAMAVVGNRVWAAGSPGSVIWHSPDSGRTWLPQFTGSGLPLKGLAFADGQHGIALGALGRICVTHNGGSTWNDSRNGSLRLACLVVGVHMDRTPLSFLTRWSKEDGYRTASLLAVRRDLGAGAQPLEGHAQRWSHSALLSGSGASEIDWRLPLQIPGLEHDRQRLLAEWANLSDRRMEEVLLREIVCQIRAWQPSALLLEEPDDNDFAALTIQQAWSAAVRLAADEHAFPELDATCRLAPWQVRKIILQRVPGREGTVTQELGEILPHLGTTLDEAIANAVRCLPHEPDMPVGSPGFVIPFCSEATLSDKALLHDLGLPVGSAARRALPSLANFDYEKLAQQVRHRKHLAGISRAMTQLPGGGDQLLAQLPEMLKPLTPAQAAQQLRDLAQTYESSGNWPAAEQAMLELARRYGEQPAGADALVWLVTYSSSAELNWQRMRTQSVTRQGQRLGQSSGQGMDLDAAVQAARDAQAEGGSGFGSPLTGAIEPVRGDAAIAIGNLESVVAANGVGVTPRQQLLEQQQSQAAATIAKLRLLHPDVANDPRLQFVEAAAARRRNQQKRADEIYQSHFQLFGKSPWQVAARGEIYLMRPGAQSPKPVVQCRRILSPPLLDGLLSDTCWADAVEIPLGSAPVSDNYIGARSTDHRSADGSGIHAVVMLAYDAEYLYIAASVPIDTQLPLDPPEMPGRKHDANLDRFDRLRIQLDIDRDYATCYTFEIDQRGMTRDLLWNHSGFDPQWYCAAVRDEASWRVECAIPFTELAPADTLPQQVWSVGISRIKPGLAVEGWTTATGDNPHPGLFGLVRF